jgi:hypothetical protein
LLIERYDLIDFDRHPNSSGRLGRMAGRSAYELNNVVHSRPGSKYLSDTKRFKSGYILIRDDTSAKNDYIVEPFLAREFHDSREQRHMRAGQNGQTDHIHVLLDRGSDDLFRSLTQTGVDYFHPGIPKRAGDYFDTAIMPVQPGLCQ